VADAPQLYWSLEHREPCRLLDSQGLWGQRYLRVWLPQSDAIVRVSADSVVPLDEAAPMSAEQLAYVTSAARVAQALTQDVLLAPMEANVIPLPHQLNVLQRAISGQRVRYLLADEVGLGKTIEAGLIMREFKIRGRVRRTLVVAPRGLVKQWVSEMKTHFNETFRLVDPGELTAYRRFLDDDNIWRAADQVVCPLDSVKPVDGRRGWSAERVADYNRERFDDLISAGWDLVICDEAHRLGGSTEQVARYRLGRGLAEAAPYLLLLTATPHQGKTDAFQRVMSLLDEVAFPDEESISRERVQPFVIRTEKRRAIDADGNALFKPRQTRLDSVPWEERHALQEQLYEAVSEYVRVGYDRAMLEKKTHVGFLLILMQRLVSSSTRAIRTTLERRLDVLQSPEEQLALFPSMTLEDWADLDGEEQMDTLLGAQLAALKDERTEVELLLELARRTEAGCPDAKAERLLELIYELQREEGDPELKVLLFTEFVPTQNMLAEYLESRGFTVACLNGSMDMDERQRVQREFAERARVLVSTDAGGEGVNLQFAHVVINYDMPWNPMRIEQRIGRVDRIGQVHVVRAHNFMLQSSVEFRVREVLERKLGVILHEFGVDKAGDVLDSADAEQLFTDLFVETLLHPDRLDDEVDATVERVRERAADARDAASLLGDVGELDPAGAQRVRQHPLPHWVERMTVNYLRAHAGEACERQRDGGKSWDLVWPGGEVQLDAVFTPAEAERLPAATYLTLEDAHVRGLATALPVFVRGQSVPAIQLPDLPEDLRGIWSLWRVSLDSADRREQRVVPVFVHDDGRLLGPSARGVWDALLSADCEPTHSLVGDEAATAYEIAYGGAEVDARPVFDELLAAHQVALDAERERGTHAFVSRRKAIGRIGLDAVKGHRLRQLDDELTRWEASLDARAATVPDMAAVLVARIETAAQ